MSLTNLTIAQAQQALRAKKFTATELVGDHIKAVEAHNASLNAFVTLTLERAADEAKKADERLAKGDARPLEGIPVGIKDLFCTKGVSSTACSGILKGFTPPYESTVTQKLFDNGAIMLGKTNMDEFAMGSTNKTSARGECKNPWHRAGDKTDLVPGGSSGGSAAAVSARLCMMATGTDTGGSIRQPASFTGIVGIKPTYGRCSRWGIVAFASSLDQAGPMTRSVRDAAIALQVMAGHDAKDSTSASQPIPDWETLLEGDLKGKKVGIPAEYRVDGMDSEITALWDKGAELLKQAGAEIVPISLPHTKYALPTYYIIAPAEASSNLARYDGVRYGLRIEPDSGSINDLFEQSRAAGFGSEVKRRILIGTYVLSAGYYDAYYKKAQRVRRLIADDFKKAYEKVDVILTPTAPSAAFGLNEVSDDPVAMYLNDVFTVPTSLAGLPAISVPAGLSKTGLPLGLQLIGKAFDEAMVLKAGQVMETAVQFSAVPMEKAA